MDNCKSSKSQGEVESPQATNQGAGRRRLLQRGGSVIAMGLASRPVLAWHCRPVSIVGSVALHPGGANGANSITTNPERWERYVDETWGIAQWAGNSTRPADGDRVDEWWEKNSPWPKLKAKVGINKYSRDIKASDIPNFALPNVPDITKPIRDLLNSPSVEKWKKRVIVAQLNLITLSGYASSNIPGNLGYQNSLASCVTLKQLQDMATGTFYPNHPSTTPQWGPSEIDSYLNDNWIARD